MWIKFQSLIACLLVKFVFAALLLTGLNAAPNAQAALEWQMDARQLQLADIEIERIFAASSEYESETHPALSVRVSGLRHAWTGSAGDMVLSCTRMHWSQCRTADVQWQPINAKSRSGQLQLGPNSLQLELGPMQAALSFASDVPELELKSLPFEWLSAVSPLLSELNGLSGALDLALVLDESAWQFSGLIEALSFDTDDGWVAAAELGMNFGGSWLPTERDILLTLSWDRGEALLGPLYLPPPELPIELKIDSVIAVENEPFVAQARLSQAGRLTIQSALTLRSAQPFGQLGLQNLDADIQIERMQLAPIWSQGLESLAESFGLSGLQPDGQMNGSLQLREGQLQSAQLALDSIQIEDQQQRVAFEGLNGVVDFDLNTNAMNLNLQWHDAALMGLDLGGSELSLAATESGAIELVNPPFRLPLLDGHLVVHQLQWEDWLNEQPQFVLNAELEPIQLVNISRAFGWPLLGGELSGYLPGMRYEQGVLQFDGGISASIFSGALQISNLEVERPFGPLPALAADIEFSQLDLFELTGAFDFGSMQGRLSGYMRDLRLLDWQPVAFDAWLATDAETSEQRRISQQAIDSISSLSGAGGAVLSNTVLRVFDDFPYANVGLGCVLSEGVCQMHGLNEQENGGYLIVEGRGLPHLDIIGYQRRVNWDRLLNQIQSATQGGVSIGQPADSEN